MKLEMFAKAEMRGKEKIVIQTFLIFVHTGMD